MGTVAVIAQSDKWYFGLDSSSRVAVQIVNDMVALLALLNLATLVAGHVRVNYPVGDWKDGALCGGDAPVAWDASDRFISLSGTRGDKFSVTWQPAPSTLDSTAASIATTLAIGTFPSAGRICANVTGNPQLGARGTIRVETIGKGRSTSTCADVVVSESLVRRADGNDILDLATRQRFSLRDYYCGNATLIARAACDCHCHGASEHCSGECSEKEIADAKAQCEAAAAPCSCHCHGASEHCEGKCSAKQIADAKALCEAAAAPCSCHCHGASEHCEGKCSAKQIADAKAQCEAAANPPPPPPPPPCSCHCHGASGEPILSAMRLGR
ncbi:hypothetical protein AURDEDRAFT_175553 [Auricularia subglabra TFB-10046 SS5]|uniref:Uncharacterized protein n=1 Tax=Auricularia subglabra (strain TFB-10046 / SS5) TaxID=717982 RepID=J0LEN3_AURST|nr:hypothetical protein AURDEDRAFT_175553 [Auricularia subglabra TFB-10046 SS5]